MEALLSEIDPKAIGVKPEEFIDKWLVREMDQSGIVKSLLAAKGSINKRSKLTAKGTKFRKVRKEIILLFVELRITMV